MLAGDHFVWPTLKRFYKASNLELRPGIVPTRSPSEVSNLAGGRISRLFL
jgi:hypothetical protein